MVDGLVCALVSSKAAMLADAMAAMLVDATAAKWVEWWADSLAEKRVGERAALWAARKVDVWVDVSAEEMDVWKEGRLEITRVLHLAGLKVELLVFLLEIMQAVSRVLTTAEKKVVQKAVWSVGRWDGKM